MLTRPIPVFASTVVFVAPGVSDRGRSGRALESGCGICPPQTDCYSELSEDGTVTVSCLPSENEFLDAAFEKQNHCQPMGVQWVLHARDGALAQGMRHAIRAIALFFRASPCAVCLAPRFVWKRNALTPVLAMEVVLSRMMKVPPVDPTTFRTRAFPEVPALIDSQSPMETVLE